MPKFQLWLTEFSPCNPVFAIQSLQFSPCNSVLAIQSLQFSPCNSVLAIQSLQFSPCNSALAIQPLQFSPCYAVLAMQRSACISDDPYHSGDVLKYCSYLAYYTQQQEYIIEREGEYRTRVYYCSTTLRKVTHPLNDIHTPIR